MVDNNREKPVWSKIERLLKLVSSSRYSGFYKKLYSRKKINIKKITSLEDFKKIPFLTKPEIASAPADDRLYIPKDSRFSIYASSGTTDNPLVMYHKKFKFHPTILTKLRSLGIKRTLVLRPPWIAGGNLTSFKDYPASQIIGDLQNLSYSAKISRSTRIDSINATATVCVYFADFLAKEYDLGKIKLIWLGGEYVSKEKLKLLKKLYPEAYPMIPFLSVETRLRAYQCDYLSNKSPSLYHPMPDFYFEILNGGKIGEEGEGELVATTLDNEIPFPLIRYRTGDLVRIYSEKCNCGETQIIEVLGRTAFDSLRVQGVTLHRKYLEKAAIKSGLWPAFDYQLHVYEKLIGIKIKVQLELHLVPKIASKGSLSSITKGFSDHFLVTQGLTLTDLIHKDIFLPIKIVPERTFGKNYKQKLIIPHFS